MLRGQGPRLNTLWQEVSDALMDILRGMDKFSWKAFETAYSLYH